MTASSPGSVHAQCHAASQGRQTVNATGRYSKLWATLTFDLAFC